MKRPFVTWGIGVLSGIVRITHAPTNVGKALAESIVVEFKNRQRAR